MALCDPCLWIHRSQTDSTSVPYRMIHRLTEVGIADTAKVLVLTYMQRDVVLHAQID